MRRLFILIALLTTPYAFGVPIEQTVCARLSIVPTTGNPETEFVAFGATSGDYFFAGLAEVTINENGEPILKDTNRVVVAEQTMRFQTEESIRYLALKRLDLKFKDEMGSFALEPPDKQSPWVSPNAPTSKIESSIIKTFPIEKCLNESQLDWTRWSF